MTRRDLLLASAASLLPLPCLSATKKTIQLSGTVLYSYSECPDLILRVTEVLPEGGEAISLHPPRAKRIQLGELEDPPVLDDGDWLCVTGMDLGRGKALKAVRWEQGTPIARSEATRSTVPAPIPTITLEDGTCIEGTRLLTLTATGYGPGENGAWGDQTKLETTVGYGTVAVDPRVIPLRSRLWVEDYGFCIALDVGGAIKGMRIDLGHNTDEAAALVGRRRCKVLVLG
ncbi:3D domain-containing protein [Armatimonas sp.]|uniref:3D domain-containing protein n=1 Tax=Armatimonas sp. TaxID=1872638 RepID=UPI00286A8F97|nr:3D domain-containing protein [Armatimonas sp.]